MRASKTERKYPALAAPYTLEPRLGYSAYRVMGYGVIESYDRGVSAVLSAAIGLLIGFCCGAGLCLIMEIGHACLQR